MTAHFKKTHLARSICLAFADAATLTAVQAQDATPAQTVTIAAKAGAYGRDKDSASAVAPTQSL
jgi:hypothetical protein